MLSSRIKKLPDRILNVACTVSAPASSGRTEKLKGQPCSLFVLLQSLTSKIRAGDVRKGNYVGGPTLIQVAVIYKVIANDLKVGYVVDGSYVGSDVDIAQHPVLSSARERHSRRLHAETGCDTQNRYR